MKSVKIMCEKEINKKGNEKIETCDKILNLFFKLKKSI